jgi:lauroyl/myristoyl acyltransferase
MMWWALFAAGVAVAERVPAALAYGLGRLVALALASFPSAQRTRLRRNLARASGESLGARRLDGFVRTAYQTQVANYVDLMRYRRTSPQEIEGIFSATGPGWASLVSAGREKRGAVLVTAHFGRIERLNHFLAGFQIPTTLPVERLQPKRLFDLVCALRAQRGVNLIPHDAGLRPCLRALARGDLVALFAEWDPTGHGVPVRFFGADALFPPGPAYLAVRSGAPLFVGVELPFPPSAGGRTGGFQGYLEAPLEVAPTGDIDADVRRVTQLIALTFERHIARYPGRWVMYHDIFVRDVSQSAGPRAGAPGHDIQ